MDEEKAGPSSETVPPDPIPDPTPDSTPDPTADPTPDPNNANEEPKDMADQEQKEQDVKTGNETPEGETSPSEGSNPQEPETKVPGEETAPAEETPAEPVVVAKPIAVIHHASDKEKEKLYPENVLKSTEGGFNDFLPPWAFPRVQIQAVVTVKDSGQSGRDRKNGKDEEVTLKHTIDAMSTNMVKAVLSQFERLSISKIYHFAQLGEFATILFREKKLVDILIHVLDRSYYAHKQVLCCHSEFFSILLKSHDHPKNLITDITLHNIHPRYFQDFLHFSYYGEIELNEANIPPLLNLCNKLNATMMRARIHMFIATHGELDPKLIKKILTSKLTADRPLGIMEAIDKFDLLNDDVKFLCRLDFDDLMEILSSDDLNIKSELDVFWAALIWVADDVRDRFHNLDMLMNSVRVTCMTTLEIMDICRATSLIRLSKQCQQLVMNATWVCHAREMGLEDPLSLPTHKPRKRLIGKSPHQDEAGNDSCIRKLMGEFLLRICFKAHYEKEPTSSEFDKHYRQYKSVIGNDDKDAVLTALEKSSAGKQRGRVIFADEKGTNLEHVYVTEPRSNDMYKQIEEEKKEQKEKEKKEKKEQKMKEKLERKEAEKKEREEKAKIAREAKIKEKKEKRKAEKAKNKKKDKQKAKDEKAKKKGKDTKEEKKKKEKANEEKKKEKQKVLDLWQGSVSDNSAVMSPTESKIKTEEEDATTTETDS